MPLPVHDQFKAMLVELAEAGMEVSREMMVGVRKATTQDERIAYGQAHDRAARSVRLTISLYERLERAEREAAREDAINLEPLAALERQVEPKTDLRRAQVRAAVRRSIEAEYEGEDARLLETALDLLLAERALTYRFTNQEPSEAVSEIRKVLKLPDRLRFWLPAAKAPDNPPMPEKSGPEKSGPEKERAGPS
ncbi:hypothetical protein [Phenylobacterium immobile]|uniref:hypothetical protein n=1 Tax=Phenylobacterium immobile TaxID=21 RepID=UPI000A54738A|nr:hypothetical protein [Phenylobacterium immobile]